MKVVVSLCSIKRGSRGTQFPGGVAGGEPPQYHHHQRGSRGTESPGGGAGAEPPAILIYNRLLCRRTRKTSIKNLAFPLQVDLKWLESMQHCFMSFSKAATWQQAYFWSTTILDYDPNNSGKPFGHSLTVIDVVNS